jgi:hypothetical protein
MKQEALPLGSKLIEEETELDRQFSNHTVTPASLKSATAAVAATQGELRETHLKYHLITVTLLTDSQRQQYSKMRGYGDQQSSPMQHHH